MPNYNSINLTIKMLSCERKQSPSGNEYIAASFDDEPSMTMEILDDGTVFFNEVVYKEILKRLLILDWLQEGVSGKTAALDCASPNDVWVKAEVI